MGVNQNKLNELWDYCEPDDSRVLYNSPATDEYTVAISAGSPMWMRTQIAKKNSSPVLPQIAFMDWVFFSTASAYDDAAINYSGTGWGGSSNIGGVLCARTSTVSDYVEWTAESATHAIAHIGRTTNGGLGIVSIDGDTTSANMCWTAQQYVDGGFYPDTILVANGGICNPTDRVVNCSRYMPGSDSPIDEVAVLLATGLTDATHTLRVTCVGVVDNESAAGFARLYISGISTLDTAPALGTNEYVHRIGLVDSATAPANLQTAVEYAFKFAVTDGGVTNWAGGVHGEENLVSTTAVLTENIVQIVRESTLENTLGGATLYANCTTVYTFSRDGLQIDARIELTNNIWPETLYMPMSPIFRYQTLREQRPNIDRVIASDYGDSVDVTADDNTNTLLGQSNVVAHYESNGQMIMCSKMNSIDEQLDTDEQVLLIDKSDNKGESGLKVDKIYIPRLSGTNVAQASGTVFSSSVTHRFGVAVGSTAQALIDSFSSGSTGIGGGTFTDPTLGAEGWETLLTPDTTAGDKMTLGAEGWEE